MDDLTVEFLVETNESLDALDLDFIKLEQNPDDFDIIGNIFRVMHTIKGTCGFLGLERLEKVAHSAENIMDKLREGAFSVTPPIISLILEANDVIKAIIAHLDETEAEPDGNDDELIARLNDCAETGVISGDSSADEVVNEESTIADPEEESTKTDDLDGEIDFEPVRAEYAESEEKDTIDTKEEVSTKTDDLDGEIDFEPVKAEYAESEEKDTIDTEETPPVVQKNASSEISTATKKKAVNDGLKATNKDAKKKASGGTASTQSIRVNLDVLENLMQMVGELVLTRNQLLQMTRDQQHDEGENKFAAPLQRLNNITSGLQEGVMQTRMQPIGNAWAKFPRLIRDLSMDLEKKIELKMIGAETELDRQMLESIRDPLTHMVRNSVDHGIEMPEERSNAGKKETGTVTLHAYHEGGHIIIKISDDGGGLNREKIQAKVFENGLVSDIGELEAMSDKQIYQYIFKAGLSTAEKVTSISGRGVGMDVVVNNIEKIGGTVEVNSVSGKGSEFLIKLPLTLAIMPVLIIRSGEEIFAIPQIRVSEIVRADTIAEEGENSGFIVETINDASVLRLRGRLLPLISLSKTLQISRDKEEASSGNKIEPFIVVCEVGSQSFGILVDKVYHTEEIVVKPVAKMISELDVYSGCTILGDGSVIMILDPNGIIKASGVTNLIEADKNGDEEKSASHEHLVSFLLFKAWSNSPKAIPLELVSRLEEIDAKDIEWSGDQRVMQYRDKLMRITMLDPSTSVPTEGLHEVIVFADEDRVMGVVVEEIIDIVKQEMDVKSVVGETGLLGSMIVNDVTTDLVDISYFFSNVFSDWPKQGGDLKTNIQNTAEDDRKRILLVDDSPFFRKFMKPVLVVAGYNVTTADSAEVAIELLEENSNNFDIVVTDIEMPEMNGIEFTAQCKKNKKFSKIPFIALTSHSEKEIGAEDGDVNKMGFFDFVSKSDRDCLVSVVASALASQNTGKAAA